MKGFPLTRFIDSMTRHIQAVSEGDETEDHLGAILWNASAMMWTKDAIQKGKLESKLDDLPFKQ